MSFQIASLKLIPLCIFVAFLFSIPEANAKLVNESRKDSISLMNFWEMLLEPTNDTVVRISNAFIQPLTSDEDLPIIQAYLSRERVVEHEIIVEDVTMFYPGNWFLRFDVQHVVFEKMVKFNQVETPYFFLFDSCRFKQGLFLNLIGANQIHLRNSRLEGAMHIGMRNPGVHISPEGLIINDCEITFSSSSWIIVANEIEGLEIYNSSFRAIDTSHSKKRRLNIGGEMNSMRIMRSKFDCDLHFRPNTQVIRKISIEDCDFTRVDIEELNPPENPHKILFPWSLFRKAYGRHSGEKWLTMDSELVVQSESQFYRLQSNASMESKPNQLQQGREWKPDQREPISFRWLQEHISGKYRG